MILFVMDAMWMFMNEFHPQNNNYHGCHLQHKFIRRCWKSLTSYIINSWSCLLLHTCAHIVITNSPSMQVDIRTALRFFIFFNLNYVKNMRIKSLEMWKIGSKIIFYLNFKMLKQNIGYIQSPFSAEHILTFFLFLFFLLWVFSFFLSEKWHLLLIFIVMGIFWQFHVCVVCGFGIQVHLFFLQMQLARELVNKA